MNKDFQRVFDQIEQQRNDMISLLANVNADVLNQNPTPGKWSILQVLAHVMTAEELSIRYMMKKVNAIDQVRNSGPIEAIKLQFLNLMQRAPLKYRAPRVVVSNTPVAIDLPEMKIRWDQNREDLRRLLDRIPDDKRFRIIYKHAIVGRLNALQALYFFREHFNHHKPQVDRILRAHKNNI